MIVCFCINSWRILRQPLSFASKRFRMLAMSVDGNENKVLNIKQHVISIAPMMDYTDTHMRKLQRMITKEAVLYTEMVVANALIRTDNPFKFLDCDFSIEEPLVLQLGGGDPKQMFDAAKIATQYGYKQINLNVGCPSEKVAGAGCFGASLMLNPILVSELCIAIKEATGRSATVKCRIGVNENDSYENLCQFITTVSNKGCVDHFIIHARKAILNAKFSPEDNRKIPPLKYDYVYRLVKDFPKLYFTINGGINNINDAKIHLSHGVTGVMIGRAVINSPYNEWRNIDSLLYNKLTSPSSQDVWNRRKILEKYAEYARNVTDKEGKKARRAVVKPLLNLFSGEPNGKLFRVIVDDIIKDDTIPIDKVIFQAQTCLHTATLDLLQPHNSSLSYNIRREINEQRENANM